jgi:DNA-binding NtrC family response regulator
MSPISDHARSLEIARRSDANLLITGPTGSGKSTLARQIHATSARARKPFVTVNLASLHEGTLESELFGHERGSFTGADQRRTGWLERAQGGTVFLDEIGELAPRLQARLLEFLQSRILTPVGGNRQVQLDVRIIAATHRDLARAVEEGTFREDLFHRLRVVSLHLPGLREREEEFDGILHETLAEVCRTSGRSILRISESVAHELESYDWPGNIRELKNVLEYAVLAADGQEISPQDLPPWFREVRRAESISSTSGPLLATLNFSLGMDFHESIARFERVYLELALQRNRGRINRTARSIGMSKATLIRRIRTYRLLDEPEPQPELLSESLSKRRASPVARKISSLKKEVAPAATLR